MYCSAVFQEILDSPDQNAAHARLAGWLLVLDFSCDAAVLLRRYWGILDDHVVHQVTQKVQHRRSNMTSAFNTYFKQVLQDDAGARIPATKGHERSTEVELFKQRCKAAFPSFVVSAQRT